MSVSQARFPRSLPTTAEVDHSLGRLADDGPQSVTAALPCVYCRADIAADEFVFWTATRRLVSATCPHCQRRVTLAAAAWRRWSRPSRVARA